MNTCRQFQKDARLFAFGELDAERSEAFRRHLEVCPECRREHEEISGLIRSAQSAFRPDALSAWESGNLTRSVLREWKSGGTGDASEKRGWFGRWVPVFATACLALIVFSWFGMIDRGGEESFRTASPLSQEEMQIIRNYDVISNLELLEEMENLEKLDKALEFQRDRQDVGMVQKPLILAYHQNGAKHVQTL